MVCVYTWPSCIPPKKILHAYFIVILAKACDQGAVYRTASYYIGITIRGLYIGGVVQNCVILHWGNNKGALHQGTVYRTVSYYIGVTIRGLYIRERRTELCHITLG